MEIGLSDSLQGLRRQAKACVTLIHLRALSLSLPAAAAPCLTLLSHLFTDIDCTILAGACFFNDVSAPGNAYVETEAQADGLMHCFLTKL